MADNNVNVSGAFVCRVGEDEILECKVVKTDMESGWSESIYTCNSYDECIRFLFRGPRPLIDDERFEYSIQWRVIPRPA